MLGRSWFITGVCGTQLLESVVARAPTRVIGVDNNESGLFHLYDEYRKSPFVKLYTADLRDRREVESRIADWERAPQWGLTYDAREA
jgi:FlaA1/EpsC-like NDP-sugar epimerase